MSTSIPSDRDVPLSHDLREQDARALEALCEAGFDCARVPQAYRARAEKCAALLGLLSCGPKPECDPSLVDVTLVRVDWVRRAAEAQAMAPLEEDALEALVVAGFDPARCPSGLRERAQRHADVLAALDVPVDGSRRDALVSATLTRVQSEIDRGERRMAIDARPARAQGGFRWNDLVSVAALLMLASAVIMPMVGAVREKSRQTACQAGLMSAANAFGLYANNNRDALPMASDSRPGASWIAVGQNPAHSNSANLFTLVRMNYVQPADLACPGNAHACRQMSSRDAMDWSCPDEVSYSYQTMFARERPTWLNASGEPTVVLADRSPVMVRVIRQLRKGHADPDDVINPTANSDNHAGRGECVLMNAGNVQWLKSPVRAGGDNIWLPRSFEDFLARMQDPLRAQPLKGTETPADRSDVFLSP
jgi:hypothetical protein